MKVLVRRAMAFGDVLMTTPVLRRLAREGHEVFVQTNYPNLFEDNHDVIGLYREGDTYDKTIDLDMAHETRRDRHAAIAYMDAAFGDNGDGHDLSIYLPFGDPPDIGINLKSAILLHPNVSWRNRMLPPAWWRKVADTIAGYSYIPVVMGTMRDFGIPGYLDVRDRFNARDQAALIDAAAAFVCGPSGLFILAGATRARVVTFLTINRAETCLPYRRGELGWGYTAIPTKMPCIGCSERSSPVTFLGCARNDYACMESFSPEEFAKAAVSAAEVRAREEAW